MPNNNELSPQRKLAAFLNSCDRCGEKPAMHGWCYECWQVMRKDVAARLVDDLLETPNEAARLELIYMFDRSLAKVTKALL
jgi:hypothetical protein